MKAALLTVGDELLIGQVINTNAAWIGEQCALKGIELIRSVTIGDSDSVIQAELESSLAVADVVFITGGLGPTHDDITRESVASYFEVPLERDENVLKSIRYRFETRGAIMPESNVRQAMVPRGFEALQNPKGSAPGLMYAFEKRGLTKWVFLTPGVPFEMKFMFGEEIFPRIIDSALRDSIRVKTILTTGIGESTLAKMLEMSHNLLDENLTLAFLPGLSKVRLRLTAYTARDAKATDRMKTLDELIHEHARDYIYGYGNESLESAVVNSLVKNKATIATAESCTGGLIASSLTDVPGASATVLGGIIAYSNDSKFRDLGVDPRTIEQFGAVSEETAVQMARGVRDRFSVDLGVATTGIMGPEGGTVDKPVGTVWVCLADADGFKTKCLSVGVDRVRNKERTVVLVLNMIRMWIS